MTLKKMLACLAAISMLGTVAMMTGCGSKDDSSSSSSSSESSKEASSDAADADSEEDGEDAVDEDTAAYADALAGTLWLVLRYHNLINKPTKQVNHRQTLSHNSFLNAY